jgi:hypothetical protein
VRFADGQNCPLFQLLASLRNPTKVPGTKLDKVIHLSPGKSKLPFCVNESVPESSSEETRRRAGIRVRMLQSY